MQNSVSSPTPVISQRLASVRASTAALVEVRRPGVRPPLDVRQTCVLMFALLPAYGLLAYVAWDSRAGLPAEHAGDLLTLMVVAISVGAVLAALAVPVRRGGHILWRTAQFVAVVALGLTLATLHMAARLADTPLMLVGLLGALASIAVNIALWSTEVRRWCMR
ncbi:hypothetical protein [Nocardiopsis sp. ATB16-24]|uniref:hypothetical protein n=1 Tax=Nocardiopsis sp. ATB16-24 TaxID=3019555 RepID=UPI0025561D97|nr:hypothetical protein [Nocardiopsis sp. ATB16-24]